MTRDRNPSRRLVWATLALWLLGGGCGGASDHAAGRARKTVKTGPITVVLAARTPEFLRIPGVIGTGEGTEGGERVIVLFITRHTPDLDAKLPREIDGYAVVVREIGDVTAPPR
jgi:hypothetical protein